MPRAALLSIHARVEGAHASSWEDRALVQVWGPRFSVFVVPARDHAIFTLARLPDDEPGRRRAEDLASLLHGFLRGRRMTDREVARGIGVGNRMRYATATGTLLIRWEGARAPLVWTVPRPEIDPLDARRELARRYLHVYGPTTAEAFAKWAGIGTEEGRAAFGTLRRSLLAVRTPIGEAGILARGEVAIREARGCAGLGTPPAERGCVLAPPGKGPRAAGSRRGAARRVVDPTRLARRSARRRRDRGDVAAGPGEAGNRSLAPAHRRGTRSGRGRGAVAAAPRARARDRRGLERIGWPLP